jgi:hypothetical protein
MYSLSTPRLLNVGLLGQPQLLLPCAFESAAEASR